MPNNSSVHGWYNIESFVISGKSQRYKEDNILLTGDELILIVDCDEQHIFIQHQRTKRLFQIPIKLEHVHFHGKFLLVYQSIMIVYVLLINIISTFFINKLFIID